MTDNKLSNKMPYDLVYKTVIDRLKQKGQSISRIEQERKTTYAGDRLQQKYGDRSVWHNKQDMDKFIATRLGLQSNTYGSGRTTRSLYVIVAKAISSLRNEGIIQDWNNERRFGIWRMIDEHKNFNDYVMIIGQKDAERFRRFKTGLDSNVLQTIKNMQQAYNLWALGPNVGSDLWSLIKNNDRIFFAEAGEAFTNFGIVYDKITDPSLAIKMWGESPRIRTHKRIIVFSKIMNIDIPFYKLCRQANIKLAGKTTNLYLATNKLPEILTHQQKQYTGTIMIDTNGPADKKTEVVRRFIRDTNIVKQLKVMYKNRCQICNYTICVSEKIQYSEVHHIHPLKDGGNDDFDNMIVLCPTHHVEFDYKIIGIDENKSAIVDMNGNKIGRIIMQPKHKIAIQNIRFHLSRMNEL